MFDIEKAKAESGLDPDLLQKIEHKVREDFTDEMMFELHFIRAIRALKEGRLTVEQLSAEPVEA